MKQTILKKATVFLLCATLLLALFAGCKGNGNNSSTAESSALVSETTSSGQIYKIGLIQYVEHPSLDTIREAFLNRLEEWGYDETKVSIDYQNAGGDSANMNSICQKFVGDKVDMILAIATPAAQVAVSSTAGTDIKVLFSAVNDPAKDLGIKDLTAPEGNVTGTSDVIPVTSTIDLALQINPELKTFGLLYNSGESNSVASAEAAKAYCKEKGIAVMEGTVSNSSEIQQVATNLCSQVDAMFTSTDNTIAASLPVVAEAAKTAKIPYYVGADSMVQDGALCAIGIDYTELGAKNADMTVSIIEGKSIAETPVAFFENYQTYINQSTLDALGISFPEDILKTAIFFG